MDLVSLEEVKTHLRITDDEDDAYIRDIVMPAAVLKATNFICDASFSYTVDTCPIDIKRIILVECGNMYDMERSSYSLAGAKKSDLLERTLAYYKKIYW